MDGGQEAVCGAPHGVQLPPQSPPGTWETPYGPSTGQNEPKRRAAVLGDGVFALVRVRAPFPAARALPLHSSQPHSFLEGSRPFSKRPVDRESASLAATSRTQLLHYHTRDKHHTHERLTWPVSVVRAWALLRGLGSHVCMGSSQTASSGGSRSPAGAHHDILGLATTRPRAGGAWGPHGTRWVLSQPAGFVRPPLTPPLLHGPDHRRLQEHLRRAGTGSAPGPRPGGAHAGGEAEAHMGGAVGYGRFGFGAAGQLPEACSAGPGRSWQALRGLAAAGAQRRAAGRATQQQQQTAAIRQPQRACSTAEGCTHAAPRS
jgi:hypothetical protein